MPVLSTIEVTLVDEEAEKRFLEAFVKAAGFAVKIPGLLELKAFKSLFAEQTYIAFTVWEDEAAIEAWMRDHREQEFIRIGKEDLLSEAKLRRFEQIGADKDWKRE